MTEPITTHSRTMPSSLNDACRTIEILEDALQEIVDCYSQSFGGEVVGLKNDFSLSRPYEIARAAFSSGGPKK